MSDKTGTRLKTGSTARTGGGSVLDEWKCPTCLHRWFEYDDEEYPEVCPRCGCELGEWTVVCNAEHFEHSFTSPSFEQAKCDALDVLLEWMHAERAGWDSFKPTQEQIDNWDYMIETCCVSVMRCFRDSDDYEELWEPDDAELKRIGWDYYRE